MDGGAWWATVHGVAKSQTWPSDFTFFEMEQDSVVLPTMFFAYLWSKEKL